jgi:hypothetical protein
VDSSAAPPAPALAEGLAQTTVPLQRRKGERRQRSAA